MGREKRKEALWREVTDAFAEVLTLVADLVEGSEDGGQAAELRDARKSLIHLLGRLRENYDMMKMEATEWQRTAERRQESMVAERTRRKKAETEAAALMQQMARIKRKARLLQQRTRRLKGRDERA